MSKISDIQTILGVTADGQWGPKSQAALNQLVSPPVTSIVHAGKASSFADPSDVARFRKCKAQGKSDQECFKVGDNGVGCWGDDTSEGSGPSCAITPDDMIDRWGAIANAKHKQVMVSANNKQVICVCKDRMPWKKNVKNGAVIDLNPDTAAQLGLKPPFMVDATWRWV